MQPQPFFPNPTSKFNLASPILLRSEEMKPQFLILFLSISPSLSLSAVLGRARRAGGRRGTAAGQERGRRTAGAAAAAVRQGAAAACCCGSSLLLLLQQRQLRQQPAAAADPGSARGDARGDAQARWSTAEHTASGLENYLNH